MNYMHKIIVVTCEEDLQLQRLMEQRQLSERESKLMIAAQMSLEKKESMAQFVIENSGALRDTTEQANIKIQCNGPTKVKFQAFCTLARVLAGPANPREAPHVAAALEDTAARRHRLRRTRVTRLPRREGVHRRARLQQDWDGNSEKLALKVMRSSIPTCSQLSAETV